MKGGRNKSQIFFPLHHVLWAENADRPVKRKNGRTLGRSFLFARGETSQGARLRGKKNRIEATQRGGGGKLSQSLNMSRLRDSSGNRGNAEGISGGASYTAICKKRSGLQFRRS